MIILKCPEIRFKNDDGNNYPNWEDKKLDNVFKFYKGKGISKIELSEEGIPCIIYGELYTKYREVIGVVKSKTNIKKELFKTNIEGTKNLLYAIDSTKVKKFLFVSSIAVLDGYNEAGMMDENSDFNPKLQHSGYAISKHLSEKSLY